MKPEAWGRTRVAPQARGALLYHRVSTADQDPTLAREALRAAAAARTLDIVESIEETCSAALPRRPGLERVLALCREGRASHVLVWKVDRFGRSLIDILLNVQELELIGVTFEAVSQGVRISREATATERTQLHMIAVMAEFERTLLQERTRLGLDSARRRGVKLGRIPGSKNKRREGST